MRVLVTGAGGFIGRHLVPALGAGDALVHALLHPGEDASSVIAPGVKVLRADVRDARAADAAVRAAGSLDVVYHLAGLVPTPGLARADYVATNVEGTRHVLRAAAAAGARHVVHASSVAVHGVPPRSHVDEDAPIAPLNAYQGTKAEGERECARFAAETGIGVTVARLTTVYGPGDVRGGRLYRDVVAGRVRMVGAGHARSQITYVDDMVDALRRCGNRPPPPAVETFILGTAEVVTVRGLIDEIARAAGVTPRIRRLPAAPFALILRARRASSRGRLPPPGLADRLDFFLAERTFDVSRAQRDLGFSARVSVREGVRRTLAWYQERGML